MSESESTGYSDLDENMVLLKKLEEDGRIAGMAFEQIRSLAVQHRDMKEACLYRNSRVVELEKDVLFFQRALSDKAVKFCDNCHVHGLCSGVDWDCGTLREFLSPQSETPATDTAEDCSTCRLRGGCFFDCPRDNPVECHQYQKGDVSNVKTEQ